MANIFANLRVGKADVSPDAPSHMAGIREGNAVGSFDREPGHYLDAKQMGKANARRSTGINPGPKNPIDPKSPTLTPP